MILFIQAQAQWNIWISKLVLRLLQTELLSCSSLSFTGRAGAENDYRIKIRSEGNEFKQIFGKPVQKELGSW